MVKRIAVVGSGISGTSTAWLLRDCAEVHLFEAQNRFGGHTHTYQVKEGSRTLAIDTGFMVYNKVNYPILSAMFEHLEVENYATDMSFSVSMDSGRLEYAGSSVATLFSQRRNLVSPEFWRMLSDILSFNRLAEAAVRRGLAGSVSLGEFLDQHRLGKAFRRDYLFPMAAAIWSCPRERIADFPARSFLRFFYNHGLIRLSKRPQWLTLKGGASTYMRRLLTDLGPCAHLACSVVSVRKIQQGVELTFGDGQTQLFDDVVLACHSNQSLALLRDPSPSEHEVLTAIPYQSNHVYLHRDERLMPRRRGVWSSWNYLDHKGRAEKRAVSVTYWMNSLQKLDTKHNYFVSLNPLATPRDDAVIAEFRYDHPVFEQDALSAQQRLPGLQGREHVWFCGAWTGYGFHEDGIRSGVEVAQALGATVPWKDALERSMELAMQPSLVGSPA